MSEFRAPTRLANRGCTVAAGDSRGMEAAD